VLRNVVAYGVVSLGALAFGRDPGCGGSESPSSGVNAPCTRTKDCSGHLVCTEGVCTEADSGTRAIESDGGTGTPVGDAADDGG
jgi:hypothetical protein